MSAASNQIKSPPSTLEDEERENLIDHSQTKSATTSKGHCEEETREGHISPARSLDILNEGRLKILKSESMILSFVSTDMAAAILNSKEEKPFPWFQLLIVLAIMLCNTIILNSWPPFSAWMVESFKISQDRNRLGEYTGWLSSSFMLGQMLSCYVWGNISDRFGRKPILMLNLFIMALTNIIFGFSQTYAVALLSHFFGGIGNACIPIVRTALSEMCSEKQQGQAFATLGAASAVGILLGPFLGGYFANPTLHFHHLFPENSVFFRFPFALPCLITSGFSFGILLIAHFYLEETCKTAISFSWKSFISAKAYRLLKRGGKVPSSEEEEQNTKAANQKASRRNKSEGEESQISLIERSSPVERVKAQVEGFTPVSLSKSRSINSLETLRRSKETSKSSESVNRPRSFFKFLCDWNVMFPTMAYIFIALYTMMFEEVFILYIRSPLDRGGLAFNTNQIGIAMSVAGFALFFYQTFIAFRLDKIIGAKYSFIMAMILTFPLYLIYPHLNHLLLTHGNLNEKAQLAMVCIFFSLRLCFSYQGFMAILMMISNSVQNWEKGSLNGVIQSLASATRFIGPPLIGVIYSWSEGNEIGSFGDFHFGFYLLALLCLLTILFSFFLPRRYDKPINASNVSMGDINLENKAADTGATIRKVSIRERVVLG